MLSQVLSTLNRLMPRDNVRDADQTEERVESSWHTSSYELASGLDVIEIVVDKPPVFCDTMPAWHPPPVA
ncbi:MAG: hypothetical protein OEU94_17515 [Aquincola sp.]|nr:hypothetical protein [Aquincola sp.]